MTIFNYDKNDYFICDLLKVSDSSKKQGDPRDFLQAQFVKKRVHGNDRILRIIVM